MKQILITIADAYKRDGATDAQWDEWCDLFDKYC